MCETVRQKVIFGLCKRSNDVGKKEITGREDDFSYQANMTWVLMS